jgi:surface antigen
VGEQGGGRLTHALSRYATHSLVLALAVVSPWAALHLPVEAASATVDGRPASGLVPAAQSNLVDGVAWSTSGSLTVPAQMVTPTSAERRPVIRYQAHAGDTLRGLSSSYGLSVNTLIWSNPTAVDRLSAGQVVLIPPVDGVLVTVKASDTVQSLASKYRAQPDAIIEFNFLRHPEALAVGSLLMIPDGIGPRPASAPSPSARRFGSWSIYPIYSSGGSLYPYGQCTWYVNTRRPAPWGGNAWQWYGRARAWGRPVGPTPRVGAIMVTWESPYWGHVAYVEQVYADGSWLVSEMNYYGTSGGGWGRVSYRHVFPGTIPLIGFIY